MILWENLDQYLCTPLADSADSLVSEKQTVSYLRQENLQWPILAPKSTPLLQFTKMLNELSSTLEVENERESWITEIIVLVIFGWIRR